MKASPLLLMLDALLGLVEQEVEREAGNPEADLPLVGEHLRRLTELLIRLAEPSTARAESRAIRANVVQRIIAVRRLRRKRFGSAGADAPWDLILTLYAGRLEGETVTTSRLGEAAAMPPTTSFRWIHALANDGLLERSTDPDDSRLIHVSLGDAPAARVEAYLKTALRMSPIL